METFVSDTTFLNKILTRDVERELNAVYWPCAARLSGSFLYRLDLEISGLLLRICFPFNLCKHSSGDSILSLSRQLGCKVTSHLFSPLLPELCEAPAGTMPLWAPLWDQFGSQLYSLPAVIIGVNVISFTCGIGKSLLLLPLAINSPCISSLLCCFMAPIAITAGKGAATWGKLEIKAEGSRWVESLLCQVKCILSACCKNRKNPHR